jgi:hypothetical protein
VTRALDLVRAEIKLQRFQLAAVASACLLVAAAAATFVWQFGAIPLEAACTSVYPYPPGLECSGEAIQAWVGVTQTAETLPPIVAFLPWLAGLLVGGPAVSQEIETRTAQLGWTLAPSRPRWLLRRICVLLPILVVLVALPAIATVVLQGTQKPLIDPLATFDQYGTRGVLVVARLMLAFSLGVLVGAWLGRLLPTLVISAVACALALLVGQALFPHLMPAVELVSVTSDQGTPAGIRDAYRLADGRLVSWDEAVSLAPGRPGSRAYDEWETSLDPVSFGYPPEFALEVSLRESAITVAAGAGVLAAAGLMVRRRRPY